MSTSAPTIAIACGGATPASNYRNLRDSIEQKGFATVCVDSPSITQEDATKVTLETDTEAFRNSVLAPLIEKEAKTVIAVLHSYGGAYGAAAVKGFSKRERSARGLKGGVLGIIYLASFLLDAGETTVESLGLSDEEFSRLIIPADKPGTVIFAPTAGPALWPSLSRIEQQKRIANFRPVATSALVTSTLYAPFQDEWYKGLIAYVNCEKDAFVPPEAAQRNIEKGGIALTRSIGGGHGIDVENPDEVVITILDLMDVFERDK